jgi:hypothetical protein
MKMTAVAEHLKHRRAGFHGAPAAKLPPTRPAQPDAQGVAAAGPELTAESSTDSLRDATLASARLERLQWELDSAEEELCAALRTATNAGITPSALARAAGITIPELEDYLQRPSWGTEASKAPFSIFGF